MKEKTSITLDARLLEEMETHAGEYRSRSEFMSAAVEHFIRHLDRQRSAQRDLAILNRRAVALNREAEDVLAYQVKL
jgi:metal-responsive CopG/Arc/MetJ family transcriptional regulator